MSDDDEVAVVTLEERITEAVADGYLALRDDGSMMITEKGAVIAMLIFDSLTARDLAALVQAIGGDADAQTPAVRRPALCPDPNLSTLEVK